MKCKYCGKKISINASKCKPCSNKNRKGFKMKNTINMRDSKNGMWKGNKVGLNSLHEWIRNHKPKSMFCEKCGKITNKLDCANISGNYLRDISDFRWLCRSCHTLEDYKNGIRKGRSKKN